MNSNFRLKISFLILLALAASPALPAAARAAETGAFVLTVPLSGPLAKLGTYARQGAELALKTWGGGYTLEVVDENDDSRNDLDPSQASVIIGYFTESGFTRDAPRYLYSRKPVLLPFLTTAEAAGRGPATFFRLMPTFHEQGQFMATEILRLRKRPQRLLIVVGSGAQQGALATALEAALKDPPPPKQPPAPPKGQKARKAPPPLTPLSSKAQVLVVDVAQALDPEGLAGLGQNRPDLIILSVSMAEALRLAPALAESRFAKVPIWSGAFLGFREIGAAFASLGLNLHLCLPAANLADEHSRTVGEFKRKYVAAFRTHPTWISALAYDSLNLAIKAVASGESNLDILAYLAGEHHSLGTYDLAPGGGGSPPLAFMPVKSETLGFLP